MTEKQSIQSENTTMDFSVSSALQSTSQAIREQTQGPGRNLGEIESRRRSAGLCQSSEPAAQSSEFVSPRTLLRQFQGGKINRNSIGSRLRAAGSDTRHHSQGLPPRRQMPVSGFSGIQSRQNILRHANETASSSAEHGYRRELLPAFRSQACKESLGGPQCSVNATQRSSHQSTKETIAVDHKRKREDNFYRSTRPFGSHGSQAVPIEIGDSPERLNRRPGLSRSQAVFDNKIINEWRSAVTPTPTNFKRQRREIPYVIQIDSPPSNPKTNLARTRRLDAADVKKRKFADPVSTIRKPAFRPNTAKIEAEAKLAAVFVHQSPTKIEQKSEVDIENSLWEAAGRITTAEQEPPINQLQQIRNSIQKEKLKREQDEQRRLEESKRTDEDEVESVLKYLDDFDKPPENNKASRSPKKSSVHVRVEKRKPGTTSGNLFVSDDEGDEFVARPEEDNNLPFHQNLAAVTKPKRPDSLAASNPGGKGVTGKRRKWKHGYVKEGDEIENLVSEVKVAIRDIRKEVTDCRKEVKQHIRQSITKKEVTTMVKDLKKQSKDRDGLLRDAVKNLGHALSKGSSSTSSSFERAKSFYNQVGTFVNFKEDADAERKEAAKVALERAKRAEQTSRTKRRRVTQEVKETLKGAGIEDDEKVQAAVDAQMEKWEEARLARDQAKLQKEGNASSQVESAPTNSDSGKAEEDTTQDETSDPQRKEIEDVSRASLAALRKARGADFAKAQRKSVVNDGSFQLNGGGDSDGTVGSDDESEVSEEDPEDGPDGTPGDKDPQEGCETSIQRDSSPPDSNLSGPEKPPTDQLVNIYEIWRSEERNKHKTNPIRMAMVTSREDANSLAQDQMNVDYWGPCDRFGVDKTIGYDSTGLFSGEIKFDRTANHAIKIYVEKKTTWKGNLDGGRKLEVKPITAPKTYIICCTITTDGVPTNEKPRAFTNLNVANEAAFKRVLELVRYEEMDPITRMEFDDGEGSALRRSVRQVDDTQDGFSAEVDIADKTNVQIIVCEQDVEGPLN